MHLMHEIELAFSSTFARTPRRRVKITSRVFLLCLLSLSVSLREKNDPPEGETRRRCPSQGLEQNVRRLFDIIILATRTSLSEIPS